MPLKASPSRVRQPGLGLYLHVPFCRGKCRYCAFVSQVFDMEAAEVYVKAVVAEISKLGRAFPGRRFATLYFGGGTPSLLPPWALDKIMRELRRTFDFSKGLEFTCEANPDSLDLETARILLGHGVNRLSLGVQNLSDETLKMLGRPHTAKQAILAYSQARQAGCGNVNLDLIYGLPGTRLRTWLDTLRRAVSMRPEHLSCYELTLEPGLPLSLDIASGSLSLPPEDERAKMYVSGGELLEDSGYLQYEISNYCRMGYQSRHNLSYWEGRDYLGIGPSAVSTVEGKRWKNPDGLKDYIRLAMHAHPGQDALDLSRQDKARETLMLGLRMTRGLKLADYNALTGANLLADNAQVIAALRRAELIRIQNGRLRLSRNGMLVSNSIIERLLPTLA